MRSRRRSSPAAVYGSPSSPPSLVATFVTLDTYGMRSTIVVMASVPYPLAKPPTSVHEAGTST